LSGDDVTTAIGAWQNARDGGVPSDRNLVASLVDGDELAFLIIYNTHAASLRRFIGAIILDRHLAEDVVHEAFLDLWLHPSKFNSDKADLRSWLRTISHRRAIDRIRSIEAARSRDLRIGIRDYQSIDHSTDQWDETFAHAELHAAIGKLTPKQREAVVLRYLGERSGPEVAREVGTTVGTAKTRVRDGLVALRALLAPTVAPDN
jgi:RNA polymerase sigma-70 factor (ECF subfamily)